MVKSIARTKKRQFKGNRFSKKCENIVCNEENTQTISASKIGMSDFSEQLDSNTSITGNRIFDINILLDVFKDLSCPKCLNNALFIDEDSRYGLCSHLNLKCGSCDFIKGFASSNKIVNESEINARFVYGMRQIGKGFSAAYKLCTTLNLPCISKSAYKKQEEKLLKVVSEVAEESMKNAAAEVITKTNSNECGVSVDGTWQRRGFTSLNGCVAAISVDTGKVVDVEVMSSYCMICKKLHKMEKDHVYESEKADHVCHANFAGSAGKMETVGATRIFSRSLEKRKLKYVKYYGDGDSKAYTCVQNTYGANSVSKKECIGHIQKRVGTHLRSLKSKTKGLSGKGKLTDTFIDRLQNYYGIAIRANVGNLNSMQQNVIAALFHCASNSKNPMHGQCPTGEKSWCFYQRSVAQKTKTYEKYPGLPQSVLNIIKPVYMKLCSRELLEKCLHGKTQNANESFNGVIWQRIPKEVFVSLKTVKLGAYDATIQYNSGYAGCLEVLNKMKVSEIGFYTRNGYQMLDKTRISDSERHATPIAKKRRKILRAVRKNKTNNTLYKSGAY